jgi:predicted GH43/DUF377 family glycosyl hydrolase
VGINNYDSTNGSVFLKISKSTIPSEVQVITAKLSRLNYDTLQASINATSDSLISFDNVPVGNWHLEAEAKNFEGKIIYNGEADITILEDKTVDVYIALTPVGSGTGNINIFVNWGNKWSDFYENPIYTQYDSPNNPLAITQPKVIYDNGVYKMWYLNLYNSAKSDIWYAESKDGINWHSTQNSPVITPGDFESWDDYSVAPGAVFKEGNYFKMYYNGFHDQYGKWNIGLAVSSDGIHWEKNSEPVLIASDEEYQIGVSSIVIYNQTYYMFYSVRRYPYYNICLATSSDGIHWAKYENNPILSVTKDWEGTGIYSPSVIYNQGKFEMIYMNAGANAFGVAYSFDGINWNKEDSPVFTSDDTYNKWASRIAYPNLSNINSELKLYYTGYKNYDDGTIALATKPQ